MVDKPLLYNIALGALRLNYQTTDPDNDNTLSVKKLKSIYPLALSKALADMDLDKTASIVQLELLAKTHPLWAYVYKYPTACVKFRRILSDYVTDNRETRIPSATAVIDNVDVILTDRELAYAEYIPNTINLSVLNPSAAMAVGYQMALMCPSLIVGKGSTALRQSMFQEYAIYKNEAQEDDQNENVDTTPDEFKSEFITARLGGSTWHSKI